MPGRGWVVNAEADSLGIVEKGTAKSGQEGQKIAPDYIRLECRSSATRSTAPPVPAPAADRPNFNYSSEGIRPVIMAGHIA